MRKIYLLAGMWAALFSAKAQEVATFEEIELQSGSFYNGSDGAGGFESGGIWFPNSYNADWSSWSGFSVSNMKDTVTAGYENQYSSITSVGADSSENYAVVYHPGELSLQFDNAAKVEGFYVTNSVYTYFSMKNGDDWTRKFGGADGSDPDYFLLMIAGTDASGNATDTVEFYLADYRSDDPDDDYIVNKWQWLDLSSLGPVTELKFYLESTDMGEWGMNTPAYFCIDNFTVSGIASHVAPLAGNNNEVKVFPNPVKDRFRVEIQGGAREIVLTDKMGKIIWQDNNSGKELFTVSALANMPAGIYFLQIKTKNTISSEKIIKY